jgi:hypothetical protein
VDLDGAAEVGGVLEEARPGPVGGGGDEATFYWVVVDVMDGFEIGVFAADVSVVVAGLPEVVPGALELTGGLLLEGFHELIEWDGFGFVDEEVDVLGHEDVGIDAGLVAGSGLFEDLFDCAPGFRGREVRLPVEATEGDEVESMGLLVSLETPGHGVMVCRGGVAGWSFRGLVSFWEFVVILVGLFLASWVYPLIAFQLPRGCLVAISNRWVIGNSLVASFARRSFKTFLLGCT